MGSNYRMEYNVDIVMCIDATYSMVGLLDTVKQHALTFYGDLKAAMEKKGKVMASEMRVRVIAYRDYLADGDKAMLTTDFFSLPRDSAMFERVIKSIEPFGGGDDPEDGLEALAYAIKSPWSKGGTKRRHVVIVWTDASTHPLGFGAEAPNYPKKMARSFEELSNWWGDAAQPGLMENNAKRLVIYAPEEEYWTTITNNWDNVVLYPSEAGNGLQELDYKQILAAIVNSI